MKSNPDFIIEEGILKRYAGPGGDVAIPAGIREINAEAFQGNVRLRNVKFPDREVFFDAAVFAKCTELKGVVLPRKHPVLLVQTFYRCRSLEKIRLSEAQAKVGEYCFYGCRALRQVSMPRVEAIGKGAFAGCRALEKVQLQPTLRALDYRAFHGCSGLEEIVVPDGVERIGTQAFAHCTGLKRVVLPRRIARVGNGVFEHCPRLEAGNIEWPGHTDAEKQELLVFRGLSFDLTQDLDPISREIAIRERAERGFCTWDWSAMSAYILALFPDMLEEFADHYHVYPEHMKEGQWKGILTEAAARFRKAWEWTNSEFRDEMLDSLVRRCDGRPVPGTLPGDLPPKLVRALAKTRLDSSWAREEMAILLVQHELQKGFELIQRHFPDLMD